MSAAELLEGFKQLSGRERMEFLQAAAQLVQSGASKSEQERRAQRDERLRQSALALQDLYEPGSPHIEWTSLDAEEFLDEY
jgi:hypothetical protein